MIASWIITCLWHMITTFQEYLSHSIACIILMGGLIVFVVLNSSLASSQWDQSLHFLTEMQQFKNIQALT